MSIHNNPDISQVKISNVAVSGNVYQSDVSLPPNKEPAKVSLPHSLVNLLDWLSTEQGVSREIALQKAIATAAYIHDITSNEGGKLLVQKRDNTVSEVILKD